MSIYWVKEERIFFFFYSSGIWLNSGQYICNILNKLLHILLSLLFALWPERDSKNRKLVKNRLYPEVMSSVLTHSLQHVETFSYLELVTSRGIFFVALHHSLQERPSQQRIRTRHGSVLCARCLHCTLVYTRSLRTGPRPIETHVCLDLSDKNITPTSLVFGS